MPDRITERWPWILEHLNNYLTAQKVDLYNIHQVIDYIKKYVKQNL